MSLRGPGCKRHYKSKRPHDRPAEAYCPDSCSGVLSVNRPTTLRDGEKRRDHVPAIKLYPNGFIGRVEAAIYIF